MHVEHSLNDRPNMATDPKLRKHKASHIKMKDTDKFITK